MLVLMTQRSMKQDPSWVFVELPDGTKMKVSAKMKKFGNSKSAYIVIDAPKNIKISREELLNKGEKIETN